MKSAWWIDENEWVIEHTQPELQQPPKPKRGFTVILVAGAVTLSLLLLWAGLAYAHVPGHPEWNDVLGASTNQQGTSCCGQGDVHLLDFDEWRETTHGYEVFVVGEWREVAKWQVTTNKVNPTGKALVWYSEYLAADLVSPTTACRCSASSHWTPIRVG